MTIEAFARRWAQTPVLAGQPPAVQAAVTADRLRNTPAGLAAALRGLGTGALPSLWDRLGELAMPVALIVGERDAKFRAIAERMAAALPSAAGEIVPGAGHAVHLEDPERRVARGSSPAYQLDAARRPSPGPRRTGDHRSAPPDAAADRGGSANTPSVASPHARSGRMHGGGVQRGGDPQRAVERRGEVDLVAGRAGPRGGVEQARRSRRSGRSSGRSASAARSVERPGITGGLVERERDRGRSARSARIASTPATGSSHSSIPTGSSTRSVAIASSDDQAPLASSRIAICGPPKARTAASRPASSPIADLDLDRPEAGGAGLRRPRGRRPRGRRRRSSS